LARNGLTEPADRASAPRDARPRASDYASSIMLIAIPAIALSMVIILVRNTIQHPDLG
jgi:hypothetical protein